MQAPLRLRASLDRAAASSATPMNIECQSSRDLFSIPDSLYCVRLDEFRANPAEPPSQQEIPPMPSPFRPATELMVQYAAYHRDRRNIATHFVGIPLIVFAVGLF